MPSAHARRTLIILFIVLISGLTLTLKGETDPSETQQPNPSQKKLDWRKKLDREALKAMSPEDRRATVLAHRAEWAAAAREAGFEQGPAGYKSLPEPKPVARRQALVPGTTIRYDSGTATGFITLADSGRSALNRFDSALNATGTAVEPVKASGSLTMITFSLFRTSGNVAYWSLYSDAMGTTANFLTDVSVPVNTGLNTINVGDFGTVNNTYMGRSFLAGVFQLNTAFTRLAVDSNSTLGQGFHAVSINDIVGTQLNSLGSFNFIFRVSGNVAVPVELMKFEIE